MLLSFGIAFLVIVVTLAQLLRAPTKEYITAKAAKQKSEDNASTVKDHNYTSKEMLKTPQFYMLWFMYACGAGAGLMIIAKLAKIGEIQANIELGFVLVAVLAIGNGGGRILAGMLSDKIGRKKQCRFVLFYRPV